ncbi:MAG: tetratricopeptide repeat protein, partial [Pseudomonadales bacterium]|nr:tetratricopeptide repeat protein [Pseudomonadales bacterium]
MPPTRLLPLLLVGWSLAWSIAADETAWRQYRDAGMVAHRQGNPAEAVKQTELALAEADRFGERDTRFAETVANLAFLYREAGRLEEAERAFVRSLSTWEAIVGDDHGIVGQTLNNLGALYDAQGRFDEAEPIFERAVVIAEKTHGSTHPAVAAVSYNLGRVYQARGRF